VLRVSAVDSRLDTSSEAFAPLSFWTRLWFAWVCLVRVLFSGNDAARVYAALRADRATSPRLAPPRSPAEISSAAPATTPALQLLALFQREGRLVDFLKQDIAAFSDADVGAAARVVHEGCRRALEAHAQIAPIRAEPEGGALELSPGFDISEVKLTGQVQGAAPYRGILRHRGWRATSFRLPVPVSGHNPSILAPAEVEL